MFTAIRLNKANSHSYLLQISLCGRFEVHFVVFSCTPLILSLGCTFINCIFFVVVFPLNLFFNWRRIAEFLLFCQTSTRVSHRHTHVLSFSNLPPISLPNPTLLDWPRAPVWVLLAIQQIPIGYLFYKR